MISEFSTDDETRERMAELARLVYGIRTAFADICEDYRWKPAAGSVAAADIQEFERLGGVQNPYIVLQEVCTYLELASAYASGLGAVIAANEVLVSPWPLMRGVLESCASATAILGERPPAGTAVDRLANAYNDRLFSDSEAIGRLKDMKSSDPSWRNRRSELHAEIRAVFPGITRADMDSCRVNGVKRRNMIALMEWYFSKLQEWGGYGEREFAKLKPVYDMLSNHTHPTLYAIEHRQRTVTIDGESRTILEVEQQEVERLVGLTIQFVRLTFSVVCQYGGWQFDKQKKLERLIDEVMPALFGARK